MKIRPHHASIAALLLAAACGSSGVPRSEPSFTPTTPSATMSPSAPTPSTPTSPQRIATKVAFTDRGDLYLYEVADDLVRPLVVDGPNSQERSPHFTDAATVTYAAGPSVTEVDTASGVRREIRKMPGEVRALTWNADRSTLAVLFDRHDPNGTGLTLHLAAFGDNNSRDIRRFKPWDGRGGSDSDDVSVSWSPDATKIIVVITPPDTVSNTTMFVLDTTGKDLVPPRFGTMARWGADSQTIYYRDFGAMRAWHTINIATGGVRDPAMTRGTVRPALSPDGTVLAYDDGARKPTIYLFDVRSGRERKLTAGYVGPLWLSQDALAATVVRECVPGTDCEGNWVHERDTVRIAVGDGSTRPLTLRSTVYSAVAFYE
jgi:hypothetical protein